MAQSRKYAALPDLDLAPDVYQTPELTDDNSTLPNSTTVRSGSPASSYASLSENEDTTTSHDISYARLRPNEARSHFSTAKIDSHADFSDRVNGKRKSYRASSRRHRREREEIGDLSGEEDESLQRKLARLKREVQEAAEEVEYRRGQKAVRKVALAKKDEPSAEVSEVKELNQLLSGMRLVQQSDDLNAHALLAIKLNTPWEMKESASSASAKLSEGAPILNQSENQAITKAADFETRLTLLEKTLGLTNSEFSNFDPKTSWSFHKAILPTLNDLNLKISTLSNSSAPSFDQLSRRVRGLITEAQKLEELRKAANESRLAAKRESYASETGGNNDKSSASQGPDQVAKINSLYGTLNTIETLAPLLPPVLDRLRSLHSIHADAAQASRSLDLLEQKQEDMSAEIKKWKEGVLQMEAAVKEGEKTLSVNMKAVEQWVNDLEARLDKLDK
ncbi:MAG: hypothetical protein M1829_006506 [Trizodia sp. TS-e1964]|nr:MAG: hypothetical protein M1829_006506 [Trizodia sp. TS-e1964]